MVTKTKDLNKCYGCFACANICPQGCITLEKDKEGFFMPKIDEGKCTNCGLCDKVCIIDNSKSDCMGARFKKPKAYYGYLKDDVRRKISASGGLSYALSAKAIENGGVSFGVVGKWFEDVHHICAQTLEDLEPVCMSKNIQSRVGMCYREAKQLLNQGKKVLFTGTPCQIYALYSYLGKDYDNLLTADLICHGVPSQDVLKAYIETLEQKKGQKVVSFGRENTNQYMPVQYIVRYEDGSNEIIMPDDSLYRKGFLSNLFQRKSCAKCKFSRIPRCGDIAMGDVMFNVGKTTIQQFDPDNLGTSLILTNSEKGEKALQEIAEIFEYKMMDLDIAIGRNRWVSHGIEKNPLRKNFYDVFLDKGFEQTAPIIEKSYQNMREKYIRDGKLYRIKLLFHPIKLTKKVIKKLRGR